MIFVWVGAKNAGYINGATSIKTPSLRHSKVLVSLFSGAAVRGLVEQAHGGTRAAMDRVLGYFVPLVPAPEQTNVVGSGVPVSQRLSFLQYQLIETVTTVSGKVAFAQQNKTASFFGGSEVQVLRTLSRAVPPSCQTTKELSVAGKITETLTSAIVF